MACPLRQGNFNTRRTTTKFKAIILGIGLALMPVAAHADGQGHGRMNVAVDPYGRSATICGFQGGAACRRIYSNYTWDSGDWSGGFNYAITFGWGQNNGDAATAMCLDTGAYIPWWSWTHDTNLTCVDMFGLTSGQYVVTL